MPKIKDFALLEGPFVPFLAAKFPSERTTRRFRNS